MASGVPHPPTAAPTAGSVAASATTSVPASAPPSVPSPDAVPFHDLKSQDPLAYHLISQIGAGTYGQVWKGMRPDRGVVALKQILMEEEEGVPATALREMSLLRRLSHPNVIRLFEVVHSANQKMLTMVFECMDCDLRAYREDKSVRWTAGLIRRLLWQLLRGVQHCHDNYVLHRDLKPQNLLINRAGELKIADFGLARSFDIPVKFFTHEVVTLWYRAPEVLLSSNQYTTALDMWSVGCIFAEMVLGKAILQGSDVTSQLVKTVDLLGPPLASWPQMKECPDYLKHRALLENKRAAKGLVSLLPELDSLGHDLLAKLLTFNPDLRPSATQALAHPYFNSLHAPSTSPPLAPSAISSPPPHSASSSAKGAVSAPPRQSVPSVVVVASAPVASAVPARVALPTESRPIPTSAAAPSLAAPAGLTLASAHMPISIPAKLTMPVWPAPTPLKTVATILKSAAPSATAPSTGAVVVPAPAVSASSAPASGIACSTSGIAFAPALAPILLKSVPAVSVWPLDSVSTLPRFSIQG